ncbi:MAG: hypothetical protein FJW40_12915 [Acidobacteria bacterium]|nr:hypothetical protein [Acidobacteriota bacterium]
MLVTALLAATFLNGQAPAPVSNRLTLSWLVREDIFAGILANDRARFEKGVATLAAVGQYYPEPEVLGWRIAAETLRAVWAHEAGDQETFRRHYSLAMVYTDQCRRVSKGPMALFPEIFEGASMVLFADRLPEPLRKGAWERGYRAYAKLSELEKPRMAMLPPHVQGEILAGVALAAHKTGRDAEVGTALDAINQTLPGSPYAAAAKKWADPALRGKVQMVCVSCHDPHRLGSRIEAAHRVQ